MSRPLSAIVAELERRTEALAQFKASVAKRVAALEARRAELAAEVAQALGLGGTPVLAQAAQPQGPPRAQPGFEGSRRSSPRQESIMAKVRARPDERITPGKVMKWEGISYGTAKTTLHLLVAAGELVRLSRGQYALAGKAGDAPKRAHRRTGRPRGRTPRMDGIIAKAKPGEVLTPYGIAKQEGMAYNAAKGLLYRAVVMGRLVRMAQGQFALPGEAKPAPAPKRDKSSRMVALARDKGGKVTARMVVAAGICDTMSLAGVLLADLHKRGSLVRIDTGVYATVEHAAELRRERKAERNAGAPEAPPSTGA